MCRSSDISYNSWYAADSVEGQEQILIVSCGRMDLNSQSGETVRALPHETEVFGMQ